MYRGALLLFLAVISIMIGASVAKSLFPILGAELTVSVRLAIGSLILFVAFRAWRFKPKRSQLRYLLFYGLTLGLMNLTFYMAIARIPLGIAIALEFTGPLAVALIGTRHWHDIIWVAFAITGIALLLPVTQASAALDVAGVILALAAGVCWALYIVASKCMTRHAGAEASGHSGVIVAWGMLVAALIIAPVGAASSHLPDLLNAPVLLTAAAMALLSSAVPYSLEMAALKRLPAKTYGILASMEPAAGALAGFLFLSEILNLTQVTAIACIITASVGSLYFENRRKQEADIIP